MTDGGPGTIVLLVSSFEQLQSQRIARQLRELASDLADLVVSGDMSEQEANEWMVSKQDQWIGGGC